MLYLLVNTHMFLEIVSLNVTTDRTYIYHQV